VAETGIRIPGWSEMIDDLKGERREYELDQQSSTR
jgi:hypothetical protein